MFKRSYFIMIESSTLLRKKRRKENKVTMFPTVVTHQSFFTDIDAVTIFALNEAESKEHDFNLDEIMITQFNKL